MNTRNWLVGLASVTVLAVSIYFVIVWNPPATPPAADPGCLDWRWIAVKEDPEEVCPYVPGWNERQLFAAGPLGAVPPGLRPFCLYEAQRTVNPSMIGDLLENDALSSAQRDCVAVAPSAGALAEATGPYLRDHFRSLAARIALRPAPSPTVRLALLDTEPTGGDPHLSPPKSGKSRHGDTLANLADDLLCRGGMDLGGEEGAGRAMAGRDTAEPAGARPTETVIGSEEGLVCPVRLTARLALPVVGFDPLDPHSGQRDPGGGFVGTLGDLATAIRAEVADWESEDRETHLVLNLSLAWDPEQFQGLEEEDAMPLRAKVVYLAVQDAVCRGALVVAAAGNALGGPGTESGPLLPAAWETRAAPDPEKCRALAGVLETPESEAPPSPYRPLVHAAGGVGSDGTRPLANARPGGMPRLVAYGDHAVTDGARGPTGGDRGPTATLTGSSVSALVVSATAAAVWHYQPDWQSHQVMDEVYGSGTDLGRPADFTLAGQPFQHRASLCRAVAAVCQGPGCPSSCPAPSSPPDLTGVDLSAFHAAGSPPTPIVLGTGNWKSQSVPAVCRARAGFLSGSAFKAPGHVCPFRQLPGMAARPWVGPAPEIDPCPNCTYNLSSQVLMLEIDPDFPYSLTDPTLVVGGTSYSLPVSQSLSPGSKIEIESVQVGSGDEITLEFTVSGQKRSVQSAVLVTM